MRAVEYLRLRRNLLRFVLIVWTGLSLVALAGLYYGKLWKEDVAWYAGRSVAEQRARVLERAGTPYRNLDQALTALASWPADQGYTARGDFTQLSYFKYLAIPHLPDGTTTHSVQWADRRLTVSAGTDEFASNHDSCGFAQATVPSPFRFALSVAFVLAMAFALKRLGHGIALTLPECSAASVLVIGILTPLSRHALGTAIPGYLGFLLLAALLVAVAVTRGNPTRESSVRQKIPSGFFLAVVVLVCGWSMAKAVIVVPDDWDAWAIWGAKAKVLALGAGSLADVRYFGHADYPLLWPALWSFSAWVCGGWEEHWCRAWGAVLLALSAWQLRTVAWASTRSATAAWISPLILLTVPKVLLFASWGYAEAALWLMLTCAGGRFLRWLASPNRMDAFLVGVFCAGASLTKNEGVMFSLLFLIAMTASRPSHRTILPWCAAYLPSVGPWYAWKKFHLPDTPRVFEHLEFTVNQLQYALHRLPEAVVLIFREWATVTNWNVALPIAIFSCLYALCYMPRHVRIVAAIPLMALGTMFVIVINSPDPLHWQIGTAWDRLTAQALPLMAMVVALIAGAEHKKHDTLPFSDPSDSR